MKHKIRIISLVFTAAALIWGVYMFVLALQTATESAHMSTGLIARTLDLLGLTGKVEPATLDHAVRKCAHFVMFALEGLFIVSAFITLKRLNPLACVLITLVLSVPLCILNELAQTLADGRSCEIRDMLLDFTGVVAGIAVAQLVVRAHRRRR